MLQTSTQQGISSTTTITFHLAAAKLTCNNSALQPGFDILHIAYIMSEPKKPMPDAERMGFSHQETGIKDRLNDADMNKPHYPVWQWVLTLVGLYTGALLYGMSSMRKDYPSC